MSHSIRQCSECYREYCADCCSDAGQPSEYCSHVCQNVADLKNMDEQIREKLAERAIEQFIKTNEHLVKSNSK